MTAKQEEAIRIIQILDDSRLNGLMDQLKALQKEALREYRKTRPVDFGRFPEYTDRGVSADEYVRLLRENDRN